MDTSDPGAGGATAGRTFGERMKDVPASHEPHMPNPGGGQPAQWWWDTQPGIGADWLPEGLFPEIDELRTEHLRRLDEVKQANGKVTEIIEGFEAEDAARDAALYAGDPAPAVTNTAERTDAVREAEAEAHAARLRLDRFYRSAEAKFQEMLPTWQIQFAQVRAERAAVVEQARAALEAAEQDRDDVDQAEQWVRRTVKPKGGRHIQAPKLTISFVKDAEAAHV